MVESKPKVEVGLNNRTSQWHTCHNIHKWKHHIQDVKQESTRPHTLSSATVISQITQKFLRETSQFWCILAHLVNDKDSHSSAKYSELQTLSSVNHFSRASGSYSCCLLAKVMHQITLSETEAVKPHKLTAYRYMIYNSETGNRVSVCVKQHR